MSYTFSVNRNEIIMQAMHDSGVLGVGEQISPEDLEYCTTKLNMLVKQWQGTADFAPGLTMWSRKRADLFLERSKSHYLLGSTGDHWVQSDEWNSGFLSAASAAGTFQIQMATEAVAAVSVGDHIGIIQDNQTSLWTTVVSASGTTVTFLDALTFSAATGNIAYSYTTKAIRPLELLTVVQRDRAWRDRPLRFLTLDQYEAIPTKDDEVTLGQPLSCYYESQLGNGVLYLDMFPSDVDGFPMLHVVYLTPLSDFNNSTDTPDYPQQWYRALAAQLALDIAPGFHVPVTTEMTMLRNDAVTIARNQDGERTAVYFQPGLG